MIEACELYHYFERLGYLVIMANFTKTKSFYDTISFGAFAIRLKHGIMVSFFANDCLFAPGNIHFMQIIKD